MAEFNYTENVKFGNTQARLEKLGIDETTVSRMATHMVDNQTTLSPNDALSLVADMIENLNLDIVQKPKS